MSVKLVMFNSKGQRRAFKLVKEETVIGRADDCGLRIPHIDVSRKHCLMTVRGGQVRLRDMGSTNGTYVNNKRINEVLLRGGDRLTIGPVTFTIQVNGKPLDTAGIEKPTETNPADTSETILADIEAAIALGPDELEDSRADADAIDIEEQDSLEVTESSEQSIAEMLDESEDPSE